VRIAPSPTGEPHIGTAYTALFNFAFTHSQKGKFILRIEDTDRSRFVEEAEKNITDSLKWLGLPWDDGPDVGGPFGPYHQSERLSIYKKYAGELVEKRKAYYCDCSSERLRQLRETQQREGKVPSYDRKCRDRNLSESADTVIRLSVPLEGETAVSDLVRGEIIFQNKDIEDPIIFKSDGYPTYHLASVVDDHLMEISHVIRAEEWLSSTPKHVILYDAFDWTPPKFVHLPLLRNPDRSKISKRKNPVSLVWYREEGYLPAALLNYLATMGWSMPGDKEIFGLEDFIKNFSFDRIDPAGPIFDIQKLSWLNGEYIRKTESSSLVELLKDYTSRSEEEIKKVLPLVKERMRKLSEFDALIGFIFASEVKADFSTVVEKYEDSLKAEALRKALPHLEDLSEWRAVEIEKMIEAARAELPWSKGDFYMLVRVAVCGSSATPPLFETMQAVGKEKTVGRLNQAYKNLSKSS